MIEMSKKYGTRGNPREQVRLLCTDRQQSAFCVVALMPCGSVESFTEEGKYFLDRDHGYDLVPLDESLQDITLGVYRTRIGKMFNVVANNVPGLHPVLGYYADQGQASKRLRNGRLVNSRETDADLVERIGDLS